MKKFRRSQVLFFIILLVLSGIGCVDEEYLLVAQRRYAEKYGISIEPSELELENEAKPDRVGSNHLPYRERQCTSCHLAAGSIAIRAKGNELCAYCHELDQPVAIQDCLDCHDPHKSIRDYLLCQESEELTCQYSGERQ